MMCSVFVAKLASLTHTGQQNTRLITTAKHVGFTKYRATEYTVIILRKPWQSWSESWPLVIKLKKGTALAQEPSRQHNDAFDTADVVTAKPINSATTPSQRSDSSKTVITSNDRPQSGNALSTASLQQAGSYFGRANRGSMELSHFVCGYRYWLAGRENAFTCVCPCCLLWRRLCTSVIARLLFFLRTPPSPPRPPLPLPPQEVWAWAAVLFGYMKLRPDSLSPEILIQSHSIVAANRTQIAWF